jgi:hypothetical protein
MSKHADEPAAAAKKPRSRPGPDPDSRWVIRSTAPDAAEPDADSDDE